ncbi:hypothetical protein MANES_13G034200v8 [Manihot esculenta]|uniref:LysM domain-containing protein n=1 Tax=Manihot esculenta TaxID=3983 RepID=A0A2C9UNS4_MANES|nr:hypothetical protein MANES_13G034200v8 [Manihot esculenta]
MAKATTFFFYLALMLSFLLIASIAESRSLLAIGITGEEATPDCDSVYGVITGDTCFSVTQMFNLTTPFFDSINPNLNCDKLFVGQWLCVDGSAS